MNSRKNSKFLRILGLLAVATSSAWAQNAPVPAAFQQTYGELQTYIANFDTSVSSQWNSRPTNLLFSADLLNANGNRGLQLLRPTTYSGILAQLDALQSLGMTAVTVTMGFPLLDQDFYTFNGDPNDFTPMVTLYASLASEIHKRGMKMVVESALLWTGYYSTGSGFNLSGYYASLSDDQLVAGRVKNILTIAQQVKPDYINLNSEPDTELNISNKSGLYGSASAYGNMVATTVSQLHAAGVSIPLGAGVGTWLNGGNASDYVMAVLNAGIDYLDLHIYPVNFNFLPQAITYADMAAQAGKRVAISEAWCLKESDAELMSGPHSTDIAGLPQIYMRDSYSFWAPLDQAFLQALTKFAYWKNLLYFSPFWSRYFWAYLDYNQVQNVSYDQVNTQQIQASQLAMLAGQSTLTGQAYGIDSGQAVTLSAASYVKALAPDSLVSLFGFNLSRGTDAAESLPLPTSLANTEAVIQDSSGNQQAVPLLYVSSGQVNAAIPPGLRAGPAVITVSNNGAAVAHSKITLGSVAPGIFTANQNGAGVPVATVVSAHAGSSETFSVLTFQGPAGNYAPAPIDLGAPSDLSVLVLYGTGIRGRSSLANVRATIGGVNGDVQYAGPTAGYVGLDQVNIGLPHALAGAGQVNVTVTVDGVVANLVTLDFK